MNDISVIIPINEINEVIEDYLNKCVQSIVNQTIKPDKVYISHADTKELNNFFNSWQKPTELDINILVNKNKTDFCSQVNYSVDNIDQFIDREEFIDDVISEDGRGHTISSYDGLEGEVTYDNEYYYIYRMN